MFYRNNLASVAEFDLDKQEDLEAFEPNEGYLVWHILEDVQVQTVTASGWSQK